MPYIRVPSCVRTERSTSCIIEVVFRVVGHVETNYVECALAIGDAYLRRNDWSPGAAFWINSCEISLGRESCRVEKSGSVDCMGDWEQINLYEKVDELHG